MDQHSSNPLAAKLGAFAVLTPDDHAALDRMISSTIQRVSNLDLIQEGARHSDVIVMLGGWACRYKALADGGRQIMAYLLTSDLCDPYVFILDRMDHSIGLLTDAKLAFIKKETIVELTNRHPRLARSFWWSSFVDEAVIRHWLINLGQRDAFERVAYLLCELWDRLSLVGLRRNNKLEMPLTQERLGDTLGLTSTHENLMVQRLRGEHLISTSSKSINVLDIERLRDITQYDPAYLHLRT